VIAAPALSGSKCKIGTFEVTEFEVVFDGGSKGNPGFGYGSFVIIDSKSGQVITQERVEFGDDVTNNEAEYRTLIEALRRLLAIIGEKPNQVKVTVFGDSQLVVNQVKGLWKIKRPELLMLRNQAVELLNSFARAEVKWHSRINSVALLGH
jgi:ribonuclease HI